MPATKKRSVRRDAKHAPRSRKAAEPVPEPILHADKPGVGPEPVALKTSAPVAVKTDFPARTTEPARLRPIPSILVNGNVKTAADGVKSAMTCAEIGALDAIAPEKFKSLRWHGKTKEGSTVVTDPNAGLIVEDGMDVTVLSK